MDELPTTTDDPEYMEEGEDFDGMWLEGATVTDDGYLNRPLLPGEQIAP